MRTTCVKIRRLSTNEPTELANQDMVIDPFIKSKGWEMVKPITLLDVPRWEMMQHVEKEILAPVKALRPQYLVYRDHDRIGFEDPFEIGWFLTELKKIGVKVITAADGMEFDGKDPTVMMKTVHNQMVSSGEIKKKSERCSWGRRKTLARKSSPGKLCPYGYDFAVYGRDNHLKYRIVYEGLTTLDGWRTTRSGRPKKLQAMKRTKVFPDGTTEAYNDTWETDPERGWTLVKNRPVLERGERKWEAINEERAAVVRRIFALADAPHWKTPWEIACLMNDEGIPSHSGVKWTQKPVAFLIQNPLYKGCPVDHRRSRAKCPVYPEDVFEIPLTDDERAALRIVEADQWQRCNDHLTQQTTPTKRVRRSFLSDFWAKHFLRCGKCDSTVMLRGANDCCPTRAYQCHNCGAVKMEVVHQMIDQWVACLKDAYGKVVFHQPSELDQYKMCVQVMTTMGPMNGVMFKMADFILSHMPGDTAREKLTAYRERPWRAWQSCRDLLSGFLPLPDDPEELRGELPKCVPVNDARFLDMVVETMTRAESTPWSNYLIAVYEEVFEEVNAPIRDRLAALDAELDALFNAGFTSPEMRRRCDEKANEIGKLKADLLQQMQSLVPSYRAACERHAMTCDSVARLYESVTNATGEAKAVLLAPYLDKVILHFDARDRPANRCKLSSVEIHAKDPTIPPKVFDALACDAIYQELYTNTRKALWTPERRARHSETLKRYHASLASAS